MKRLLLPLMFVLLTLGMVTFSSCEKKTCTVCTYTGIDANGNSVNKSTARDCTAPGKEINQQRCQEQASLLTNGVCNCVED